jgi:Phosphoesterase family.
LVSYQCESLGKKLFVSNGKGVTSLANPYGPNPAVRKQAVTYQAGDAKKPQEVQYIGGLFKGTLSIIPEPDAQQLKVMAKQVYDNTPYTKLKELMAAGEPGNPIPMKVGDASPIKHVFYIIKENRTYDQVLGDLPQGNGDTSLVLFGRKITPNQHALAEQFVLLDNFYVDAEVSADGHNWSTAAYANDYTEKTGPPAMAAVAVPMILKDRKPLRIPVVVSFGIIACGQASVTAPMASLPMMVSQTFQRWWAGCVPTSPAGTKV